MTTTMIDDGGPAYPSRTSTVLNRSDGSKPDTTMVEDGYRGMSLRDWFAGQALAMGEGVWPGGHLPENASGIAAKCYAVADAMLAARKGTP